MLTASAYACCSRRRVLAVLAAIIGWSVWHQPKGVLSNTTQAIKPFAALNIPHVSFSITQLHPNQFELHWDYLSSERWSQAGSRDVALATFHKFRNFPYVSDMSDEKIIQKYANLSVFACELLEEIVDHIGINGAASVVPMRHWHLLSQIVGHLSIANGVDFADVTRVLAFMANEYTRAKNTPNAKGLLHGAVWYAVGTMSVVTWPTLEQVLPLHDSVVDFPQESLHGVGHGLLIRSTNNRFTRCSKHPIAADYLALKNAASFCAEHPNYLYRWMCADGLYHAYVEYFHDVVDDSRSWLYPCNEFNASEWCFTWIFGQGMIYREGEQGVTWRLSRFLSTSNFTHLCLSGMASESNVRGCIFGISAHYAFYHDGWVAVKRGGDPLQTCLRSPLLTVAMPAICYALFNQSITVLNESQSASSLMDWCSLIVTHEKHLSDLLFSRWVMCLRASTFLNKRWLHALMSDPIHQLCTYDLPWQAGTSWLRARRVCEILTT